MPRGERMRDTPRGLTDRQEMFCQEYLVDLCLTQAYIRAGYSKKSATVGSSKLLVNPNIQARIKELKDLRAKRLEITQDMVLRELARLAFSNMKKFARWHSDIVDLVDSETISDEDAACVASLSQTITENGGTISFKLHDKTRPLELLGKHLGMFGDKKEIAPPSDTPPTVVQIVQDLDDSAPV